ncbi:MAG: 50S ribosomal protein L5 [Peptococcaceae bacterium]|jgi:large subunit ribosomal protein L5|nr:50S ribosomal protein L5 [Peptococcaceae bacterium]
MNRLKEKYKKDVVPAMQQRFNYDNIMEVPKLEKVVVNIGMGEAIANPKAMDGAVADLMKITGQKPIITKAKKSVAAFKVRTGMAVGVKVTLRAERMLDFTDKLFNIALPRVRDFRGVSDKSFDGRGNYTMGLREQLMFPEIDYDKIDKLRGMDIVFVTTARTDEEAKALLSLMGMPFSENN